MDGLRETNTVPIFSHVPSSRLNEYLFSTKVYDNRVGLVKQLAKSLYFLYFLFPGSTWEYSYESLTRRIAVGRASSNGFPARDWEPVITVKNLMKVYDLN